VDLTLLQSTRRLRCSLYSDGEEPSVPVHGVERKLAAIFAAALLCDFADMPAGPAD
jgi:hypothetical protein